MAFTNLNRTELANTTIVLMAWNGGIRGSRNSVPLDLPNTCAISTIVALSSRVFDEAVLLCRLIRAFTAHLCDKNQNLMNLLIPLTLNMLNIFMYYTPPQFLSCLPSCTIPFVSIYFQSEWKNSVDPDQMASDEAI